MLKKKIKYVDYNNVEREETFHFNISKAELTEMNFSIDGGLENLLQSIVETIDKRKLIELLKKLILESYGVKSPDGVYFEKSEALRLKFSQTEAFVELYMELLNDPEASAAFVRGILPADLVKQINA